MSAAAEDAAAAMDEAVDYGDATYGDDAADAGATPQDAELAQLQQMLEEMEQNQTKISEASSQAAAQASTAVAAKGKAEEDRAARDERSVFVGNVDFSTTGEELMSYFSSCGTIERVTILSDKFGNPKGFAYIEFADKSAVDNAVILNDTEFKGRKLKITPKRTNIPSHALRGARGGRGGGPPFRGGRGGGYGGFAPRGGAAFAAGGFYAPRGRGGYHGGGGGGYYGGPPRGGYHGGGGGYVPRGRGRGRGGGGYYGQ